MWIHAKDCVHIQKNLTRYVVNYFLSSISKNPGGILGVFGTAVFAIVMFVSLLLFLDCKLQMPYYSFAN